MREVEHSMVYHNYFIKCHRKYTNTTRGARREGWVYRRIKKQLSYLLISCIFMSWMDYFEHHKRFRAFTCGQVDRRKRSVNDLGFRSVELQFERKLTCNTFPRYSVVLNSNSFVLKICPGKYLATSNFSCYITDDKIFSIAAAAVQSSLYHFPLLDQLLVLTKGKPTSPCLLIARLRAGNVLWSRNSFSEKERHLTRVQHG